ncbi:MAG: molybdopterin guanine dinucleotide synthesis [Paracoccaceae bacterium]|nr:MAG: molybdopterin guanine dinucleotide synthesis [Paracoccaceae bacterium]
MTFDRVAVVDWSAARGRRRGRDSIWIGVADAAGVSAENLPTRSAAEARLDAMIAGGGGRMLIGADFAFGYPAGFARALTGQDQALALWGWLAARVQELPGDGSNFRDIAALANRSLAAAGPFWGNGERADTPGLPRTRPPVPAGLAPHRVTEIAARAGGAQPKSVWQLAGAGAVGAQALTGIPVLWRLRNRHAGRVAVWPFEPCGQAQVVLAEVYPSLLAREVRAASGPDSVPDEVQVRLLAECLFRLGRQGRMGRLLQPGAAPGVLAEEGWILGVGAEALLRGVAEDIRHGGDSNRG